MMETELLHGAVDIKQELTIIKEELTTECSDSSREETETFLFNAVGIKTEQKSEMLVKDEHCNELESGNLIIKFEEGPENTFQNIKMEEETVAGNTSSAIVSPQLKQISATDGDICQHTHVDLYPYSCDICNKLFQDQEHSVVHKDEQNANFSTKSERQNLQVQKNDTSDKKHVRYMCGICNKWFTQLGALNTHMETHTGERPFSCGICNKSFIQLSNLNLHKTTHTGEQPFSCDICNKSFIQRGTLNIHMRTHTGEQPYSCETCNRSFRNRAHLIKHMRTHTGERPFSCDICDKSFRESGNLNKHIRTHTGERPYSCESCNKSFTERGHLNIHMITHTGERPFSCDICNKSFRERRSLNRHMRAHTNQRTYSCEFCDRSFTQRSSLVLHIRTHTGHSECSQENI